MADRVRLLCEDRRTERFLRALCKRRDTRVLESEIAPAGRGDASVWVVKRYAASVRLLRSRRHQQNLGLIVAIDGDNKGVASRKAELAAALAEAGVSPRQDDEAIAILVPTWSIETWLALLCSLGSVSASEPIKEHPNFRHHWDEGTADAATISTAAGAWRNGTVTAPSLADGYSEAERVGL